MKMKYRMIQRWFFVMIGEKFKWLPLVNPIFLSILQKCKALEHVFFLENDIYFINTEHPSDWKSLINLIKKYPGIMQNNLIHHSPDI